MVLLNQTVKEKLQIAILYSDNFIEAFQLRESMQEEYDAALYEKPKKLSKFLDVLQKEGYYGFIVCDQSTDIKILKS